MPPALRSAVLDTNVWLDLLVFADPGVAPLADALAGRRMRAYVDDFALAEFERVLGYRLGRITLDAAGRGLALERCRALSTEYHRPDDRNGAAVLPACRDPFDQPFLELARDCCADCLVTKDRDLLRMARVMLRLVDFVILTPAQACAWLDPGEPATHGPAG